MAIAIDTHHIPVHIRQQSHAHTTWSLTLSQKASPVIYLRKYVRHVHLHAYTFERIQAQVAVATYKRWWAFEKSFHTGYRDLVAFSNAVRRPSAAALGNKSLQHSDSDRCAVSTPAPK